MSDDDPEQEHSIDERETPNDREERERRRLDNGEDGVREEAVSDSDVDDIPSQPDQLEGSETEIADEASREIDKEQSHIPQITVDKSSQLDATERVEDTPVETDRLVEVPQFQLSSIEVLDADNLTATVSVEVDEDSIIIPQFTTKTTQRLALEGLDDNQLEGLERTRRVQIPQIAVANRARIRPFDTFLDTVPVISSQESDKSTPRATDETDEEREIAEAVESKEDTFSVVDECRAGDDWITDEWPDPLELLFGSDGTDIKSENPVVVLVNDDDLVGVAETVVKRLYREIEGGEPDLWKFDTAEQLVNEERWISADSQIFTAELPDDEWEALEDDYRDKWRSIWQNRFDQLFSGQQFGAIIFNRSQIPDPEVTSLPHHPPRLVELDAGVLWKDLANVFWNWEPEDAWSARTFSQWFDRDTSGVAQNRWIQIIRSADGMFDLATAADETASDEHYALKVFVVKWLAEQLWEADHEFTEYDDLAEIEDYREIEETILTEQPVPVADNNPVTPDVMYGSQVFEVEMFFEEADESGVKSKLKQTVRKYEEVERQVDEISIVVDNLTLLLHLKELARFKRAHQAWEEDTADITLYTVDLGREELVPASEIVDRMSELSVK